MRLRRFVPLAFCLVLLAAVASGCAPAEPLSLSSAEAASQVLGKAPDEVLSLLAIEPETDAKRTEQPGQTLYQLTEPIDFGGAEGTVELRFVKERCDRIRFIFDNENADPASAPNYSQSAFQFAKQLRQEFGELYGEPDTWPDLSTRLDAANSLEDVLKNPATYHEEWDTGPNETLARLLFGDDRVNERSDHLYTVLGYDYTGFADQPGRQVAFVSISLSLPTHW